jgi:hypothetical protein
VTRENGIPKPSPTLKCPLWSKRMSPKTSFSMDVTRDRFIEYLKQTKTIGISTTFRPKSPCIRSAMLNNGIYQ